MSALIRRWPLRTIFSFGDHRYMVLGYRSKGRYVKLGRLFFGETVPTIDWRFSRSVEYVEHLLSVYKTQPEFPKEEQP